MAYRNKGSVPTTVMVSRDPDYSGNWVCDGVADDIQINAALTYVNALGGGKVVLLEGTYVLADPIVFPGNELILEGLGRDSFIDGDGLATTEHGIVLTGRDDCEILNLSIQTEGGGAKTCQCIFIEDGSDRFRIENVTIVDSDDNGIHIEGTNIVGGWIVNCTVLAVDSDGIFSNMDGGNYLDYLHIEGCTITGCGAIGIYIVDARFGEVSTNIAYANTTIGIRLEACTGYNLEDNTVYSNTQHGINLNTTVESAINNNICSTNGYHGIFLEDSDRIDIVGNVCNHNDSGNTATYDGIDIDTDCTDCNITGNYCYFNRRYGIALDTGSRHNVVGNFVHTNDRHGIWLASFESNIEGNICYLNGGDAAGTYHNINLAGTADRSTVIGNFCFDEGSVTEDGIHIVDGATYIHIKDNYCFDHMGNGIELEANNIFCVIEGNYCYANDDNGIIITAATCTYPKINDNYCNYNGLHGISVAGPSSMINDNYCIDNSQGGAGTSHGIALGAGADNSLLNGNYCSGGPDMDMQEDGIQLASGCDNVSVIGNYCMGGMGDGIELVDCDNCLVKTNYCFDNDDYGIVVTAGTSNIVENNALVGNDTAEFSDGGTLTAIPEVFMEVTDPDSYIGAHPAARLTDGVNVKVRVQWLAPQSFQELVTAQVIIVAGANGNLARTVYTNMGQVCNDEAYNTHEGTVDMDVVAVTQNELECIDVSAALALVGLGDLVGLEFTRAGADGTDTVNADCYYLGMRVRWV